MTPEEQEYFDRRDRSAPAGWWIAPVAMIPIVFWIAVLVVL